MENDKVIVAIELGSSKISGVAGQIMFDGSLKVLAYASTPSSTCIRHGAVYNLDRTANAIADVMSRLESILSTKIEKVYIGYNAKGLRSNPSHVDRAFEEDTIVSQEVIDGMFQESETFCFDGYVNLFQITQEYVIDNKRDTESEPIGVACRTLHGNYLNILLKQQVSDYIMQCFVKAGVTILDGFVIPVAEAAAVLSDDDRKQGCALVDYGADTTTVSVYKDGMLRFLRVIPLGSDLITRDLSTLLKIEHDQAEYLKCTYGLCNQANGQNKDNGVVLGGRQIMLSRIGEIIEARNEEIVRNVVSQIKASGYLESLYAGVVLTGGGSKLLQLDQVFIKQMPNVRTPRIAAEPLRGVSWIEPSWKKGDGSQLSLLSVMAMGYENCCSLPKLDEIDNVAPEDQAKFETLSLFTDDGESAQVVRDQQNLEKKQAKIEEAAKNEASESGEGEKVPDKKTRNFFGRLFDNLMTKGEEFFDENENN